MTTRTRNKMVTVAVEELQPGMIVMLCGTPAEIIEAPLLDDDHPGFIGFTAFKDKRRGTRFNRRPAGARLVQVTEEEN